MLWRSKDTKQGPFFCHPSWVGMFFRVLRFSPQLPGTQVQWKRWCLGFLYASTISRAPFSLAPVDGLSGDLATQSLMKDLLLGVLQSFSYFLSLFSSVDIISASGANQKRRTDHSFWALGVGTSQGFPWLAVRVSQGVGWVTPSSWPPIPECFPLAG